MKTLGRSLDNVSVQAAKKNTVRATVRKIDFDYLKVIPAGTSQPISARLIGSSDNLRVGDLVDITFTEREVVATVVGVFVDALYALEEHKASHSEDSPDWIKPIYIGAADKTHKHDADDISTKDLDADLLDGVHGIGYALVAHTHEGGGLAGFHGCKLANLGGTDITGTEGDCPFTYEYYDTDAFHDNTTDPEKMVVPVGLAGYYNLTVQSGIQGYASGQFHVMLVARIGVIDYYVATNIGAMFILTEGGTDYGPFITTSMDLYLNEGDYVTVRYRQNTGTTLGALSSIACLKYLGA